MTDRLLMRALPLVLLPLLPHCSEVTAQECPGGVIVEGVCLRTSPLCEGVDCSDNDCTEAACDPETGTCQPVGDGAMCDFGGLPGLCESGECTDADLCAGIDCSDNECTEADCDPATGNCVAVSDGTSCDFDGSPGRCMSGACEDAMLCAEVDCSDGNDCTSDVCDPNTGNCSNPNATERTPCDFGGLPGECISGACEDAMLCAGQECEDNNVCTNNDCDPQDGQCLNSPVANETFCTSPAFPFGGACFGGDCTCDPNSSESGGCQDPVSRMLTCEVRGCTAERECVDLPNRTSGSCQGGLGSCNREGQCEINFPF